MTVETNNTAKDWLATNAGVGDCFVTSGVTFYAADDPTHTTPLTGATFNVITMLYIAGLLVATQDNIIVNGKSYNNYLSETGETSITNADIIWVAAHDEATDTPPNPYCTSVIPEKGYLKVTSSPTGATVKVGTITCSGTTPITACELPVGSNYTVTISLTGYITETRSANITAGATTYLGTVSLTEKAGDCELLIATWPGNADYWIDKATTETPDGKTKSLMEGADHIWLGCGYHTVEYKLEGYEYPSTYIKTKNCKIGVPCDFTCVLDKIISEDTGFLDVSAWKEETPTEEITNAIVRVGTKSRSVPIGFTPLTTHVVEVGSLHVIVRAEDRADYEETVTIEKNTTTTINAIMKKAELKAVIRMGVGVAWMDDWSLDAYTFWSLGSYQSGWIRVETGIVETFQARICFIGGPVSVPAIYTAEKTLTPYMTASERHLDWEAWYVDPAYVGEYTVIAQLKMGVGSWPSPCPE